MEFFQVACEMGSTAPAGVGAVVRRALPGVAVLNRRGLAAPSRVSSPSELAREARHVLRGGFDPNMHGADPLQPPADDRVREFGPVAVAAQVAQVNPA